jgi:hypothetical protein
MRVEQIRDGAADPASGKRIKLAGDEHLQAGHARSDLFLS